MRKILMVSTVSRQFYLFEQGNIEVLKSLGYEIHGAANFDDANERLDELDIIRHDFDIQRSPFSLKNIKAYKQLKEIMRLENFDAVHCHSPMGGVLGRIAAHYIRIPRVIYTAHGFHFYKGAPLKNWLLYYPVERLLARYTDVLITINKEDYKKAKKFFKAKKVAYIPGVGIDINKFNQFKVDKRIKRKEIGLQAKDYVLLSIGEINKNKNHEIIIRAIKKIDNPNIHYIICGEGVRKTYIQDLIKQFKLEKQIKLLGFRKDIDEICQAADVFVFPSYREGLSVALMEAMASGLPVICSDIRGNNDLIKEAKGGYLVRANDVEAFANKISVLYESEKLRKEFSNNNIERIRKYSVGNIMREMKEIYNLKDE